MDEQERWGEHGATADREVKALECTALLNSTGPYLEEGHRAGLFVECRAREREKWSAEGGRKVTDVRLHIDRDPGLDVGCVTDRLSAIAGARLPEAIIGGSDDVRSTQGPARWGGGKRCGSSSEGGERDCTRHLARSLLVSVSWHSLTLSLGMSGG
jgi:hypothetical protein